MDSLTHALNLFRLRGSLYCRSELGTPWGIRFNTHPCAVFHVLHEGQGVLSLPHDQEQYHLNKGDIILLPRGDEHTIQETPFIPVSASVQLTQWGECAIMRWSQQPVAVLLCGTFEFENEGVAWFLKRLPRVIHIKGCEAQGLSRVLALMAEEAEANRLGKTLVLRRLSDILFVQIVQHWVEQNGIAASGWLGALHDPLIRKALDLIHTQPEQTWTVSSLARATAMSRSAFAARFRDLVGEPPLKYLTRWRMQVAAQLLTHQPKMSLCAVAEQVGYTSEAAFCKTFKRMTGQSPLSYRHANGTVP